MARALRSSIVTDLDRREPAAWDAARRVLAWGGTRLDVGWIPLVALEMESAQWRDLVGRTLEPNVFLEPAFARAAATHLGARDVGAVVVRAGPRLVGLLPGRVEGIGAGRPVPTFVAWTHPFAPLGTPLVDRKAAGNVAEAMLAFLPILPGGPRLAVFPRIAETGPVARLFADHLARAGRTPYRLDPHRRAALVPQAGEALAAVSGKKRKELRRQRRRLAELGTLAREPVADVRRIGAAVADFLAVEAMGWKGRAGSAALLTAGAARFMADAVTGLAAEGKARVDLLKLDGKTIAATITLLSGDRAWFWKIAYDETFARFSPGVQLTLDLTEVLAKEQRISLVDSCAVGGHPMIDHLWSGRLAIADWLIPLGEQATFTTGIIVERTRRALIVALRALRDRLQR